MTLIISATWTIVSIISISTLSSSLDERSSSTTATSSAGRRIQQQQQQQQQNQADTTATVDDENHSIMKNNYRHSDRRRHSNYYNFTTAICLITTDAETYFQEWIDYHLFVMNFDAIVVYDNSLNFDLKRWLENTRTHPIYQNVIVQHRPGPGYNTKTKKHLQSEVYEDCIQQYGQDKEGPQYDYL